MYASKSFLLELIVETLFFPEEKSILVENGVRGWVVPKEDPQALANAMMKMITLQKTRRQMRLSALDFIKRFDAQSTTQQVLNVYEMLLVSKKH